MDQIERRFRVLGWSLDEAVFTPIKGDRRKSKGAHPSRELAGLLFGFMRVLRKGESATGGEQRWWAHCEACDPKGVRPRLVTHARLIACTSGSCRCQAIADFIERKRGRQAAE